jgi:hypothetical protein
MTKKTKKFFFLKKNFLKYSKNRGALPNSASVGQSWRTHELGVYELEKSYLKTQPDRTHTHGLGGNFCTKLNSTITLCVFITCVFLTCMFLICVILIYVFSTCLSSISCIKRFEMIIESNRMRKKMKISRKCCMNRYLVFVFIIMRKKKTIDRRRKKIASRH